MCLIKVLSSSLLTAPQVVTRVFTVTPHELSVEFHILCYLDDWSILASVKCQLLNDLEKLLTLFQEFGVVVNWDKSSPHTRSNAWAFQSALLP